MLQLPKKTKHMWGVKTAMIMSVAHVQSQFVGNVSRNWVKTTTWYLQKGTDILCWYHVDQTGYWILQFCSQIISKVFLFFFSNKSMSCMKTLFDFLPWSVNHYGTSKYTKVLLNCVYCGCNTPNFVFELLWSYKFSLFSQFKKTFEDLPDLGQFTSIGVLSICIVCSQKPRETKSWIVTVANKISFGQLTGLVALGLKNMRIKLIQMFLTCFRSVFLSYNHWKHMKTSGFLWFSE